MPHEGQQFKLLQLSDLQFALPGYKLSDVVRQEARQLEGCIILFCCNGLLLYKLTISMVATPFLTKEARQA